MNTLNYIGCKHTLYKHIENVIISNINNLSELSFSDLFAGTGIVSFNIKDKVKYIISNDLEYYSFVINNDLLNTEYNDTLKSIIEKCNKLMPSDGLFSNNYSPNNGCERMFFTVENARMVDSIRTYIENIKDNIMINEYYFLLASLLTSIDKYANTTSVYGAYLKKYKTSALKTFILVPIHTQEIIKNKNENMIYNSRIEDISDIIDSDIVYLDPPYNNRQYAANYCPLNYLARYDEDIELKGKTGLLESYNKSDFCVSKKIKVTFSQVIEKLNAKHIFISYNNEGLLSSNDMKEILLKKGDVKLYKINYKKYKSNAEQKNETVFEYVWYVNVLNKTNSFEEIII